jgi:ribosome recycling factor
LGLTPNNDGKIIRLQIPTLTTERRRDLTKAAHRRVEEARVSVRNIRRDKLEDLRAFEKEKMISEDEFYTGRDELQKLTDDYIKKVDEIARLKSSRGIRVGGLEDGRTGKNNPPSSHPPF